MTRLFALLIPILAVLFTWACSPPEAPVAEPAATEAAPVAAAPAAEVEEPELIRNATMPEEGLLLGGQPTIEQLDGLAEAGYKTFVDLRVAEEEGVLADEEFTNRGLEIVHVPIAGADGITQENARTVGELVEDSEKRPMVLFCGSGNRVGALLAVDAFHHGGLGAEDALQLGLDRGLTRLEPVVREQLGLPAAQEEEAAPADEATVTEPAAEG